MDLMEHFLYNNIIQKVWSSIRGRSQTTFTRGGGVGGQKKVNLVNVVCERPLTVVSIFWLDEILLEHTNVQYPNLICLSYNNNAVLIFLIFTIEVNGQKSKKTILVPKTVPYVIRKVYFLERINPHRTRHSITYHLLQ